MNQFKNFIQISDLKNSNMINGLLLKAIFFAKNLNNSKKYENTFLASLFMEPSTRTDMSFRIACERLGVSYLNLDIGQSSFEKGESFEDTVLNLAAMGVQGAIVRTKDEDLLSNHSGMDFSFINAGSGKVSHPTQAMLDLLTIQESLGRIENLKLAIVGDIEHSRVAASNIELHKKLGNEVLLYSPPLFTTPQFGEGVSLIELNEALVQADVVMLLRVQKERHESKVNLNDEYLQSYGLTLERLKLIKKDAIILHPGPMNRGVEIDERVLNDSRVKILDQVKNGVPMRMAIIDYILGGEDESVSN